jgi:hypothetical protein
MNKRLDFYFDRGMSTSLRLPRVEEPTILDQLQADLVVNPEEIRRWNDLVCEHHYLKNANLVGEQLRYVVTYQGQWVALLGWSVTVGPGGVATKTTSNLPTNSSLIMKSLIMLRRITVLMQVQNRSIGPRQL